MPADDHGPSPAHPHDDAQAGDGSTLAAAIERTIVELHAVFEQWFRAERDDIARVHETLHDAFTFITPQGACVDRASLMANLATARGARMLRIRVRDVRVLWVGADTAVATYEEWHDHDAYTTGRASTAVFAIDADAPHGVRWRHLHETWIKPPPARR